MGNSQSRNDAAKHTAHISKFYTTDTWIEGRAEDQLTQVSSWPGMLHVAAFPDLHPGRHGPVGAAFLADRIYPQLIGPDIGCGMTLYALDLPKRKLKLDKAVRRLRGLEEDADLEVAESLLSSSGLIEAFSPHGLGSVGSGNHFVELQSVGKIYNAEQASSIGLKQDQLCLLVHSGSRNHGARVFSGIEESWRHGFDESSSEGSAYLKLHNDAVHWAKLNRDLIAQRAADALRSGVTPICDSVHNALEEKDGAWLHRKGAAKPDTSGLAPLAGSRESLSYLMGSEEMPQEALGSLSHGAGRRYDRASMHGRIQKNKSSLSSMTRTHFGGQVICDDRSLLIEEAGHAYKDAGAVARDLEHFKVARRILSLRPLITFKTAQQRS